MKYYDFDLAKKVINKFNELKVLKSASIGMHEDWFWTAEVIFEDGKYTRKFPSNEAASSIYENYRKKREEGMSLLSDEVRQFDEILIGGLYGSNWATPVIVIELIDNTDKTYNCFIGENNNEDVLKKIEKQISHINELGCLSGPVQENRLNIDVEDFTE